MLLQLELVHCGMGLGSDAVQLTIVLRDGGQERPRSRNGAWVPLEGRCWRRWLRAARSGEHISRAVRRHGRAIRQRTHARSGHGALPACPTCRSRTLPSAPRCAACPACAVQAAGQPRGAHHQRVWRRSGVDHRRQVGWWWRLGCPAGQQGRSSAVLAPAGHQASIPEQHACMQCRRWLGWRAEPCHACCAGTPSPCFGPASTQSSRLPSGVGVSGAWRRRRRASADTTRRSP